MLATPRNYGVFVGLRSGNSSPGLNFRCFTLLCVCCSVPIKGNAVCVCFVALPRGNIKTVASLESEIQLCPRYVAQSLLV